MSYNPSAPSTYTYVNDGGINQEGAITFMKSKDWPIGLQNFLIKNISSIPYRFFICDDSGSMVTTDGKRIFGTGKATKFINSTRWMELSESMMYHSALANALNVSCEFRLLNGSAPIVIGGPNAHPDGLNVLTTLLQGSPGGGTPLCHHIQEVTKVIQQYESALRQAGQRACIIIATDGEASDGDLATAMKPLEKLPVWVVIKLCTDDDGIVDYWNGIDEKLEVDIDVLDDMLSESAEVYKANPWLNYNEIIHRMREFGVYIKEFDLLDESLLSPDQIRSICGILFNMTASEIPHPDVDFNKFIRCIETLNHECPQYYSLYHKKMAPFVDISKIKQCYGPKGSCCIS